MKRVVLIGFMGSGKSTLGKKLAKKLDIPFIDSDAEIEKHHNKSIGEIFADNGEFFFREIEAKFIDSLQDESSFVLSTGGGMPCFGSNLEKLKSLGLTLYLERSPKELAHRLHNAKQQRPLIAGLSKDELVDFIEDKLVLREEFYKQADVILDREEQTPAAIQQLLHHLQPLQKS